LQTWHLTQLLELNRLEEAAASCTQYCYSFFSYCLQATHQSLLLSVKPARITAFMLPAVYVVLADMLLHFASCAPGHNSCSQLNSTPLLLLFKLLAGIAPELAAVFHTREDLRGIVSSVLVRLCKQARAVALAAAQGSVDASAETRAAIQGLGLVSGAAAAIPGAGKGDDEAADDDEQQHEAGSEDEDAEEEYGQQQQQQRGSGGAGFGGRRRGAGDDEDAGPDSAASAPAAFTADVALAQLQALRGYSMKWLRLMCKVFIEVRACRV
jgi:hypothetical protein